MKLAKEQRRMYCDKISSCSCGAQMEYISWKWYKGVANKKHYSVICPKCRNNPYTWSNKIEKAINRWNKKMDEI